MLNMKNLVFKEWPAKKLIERYIRSYVIKEIILANILHSIFQTHPSQPTDNSLSLFTLPNLFWYRLYIFFLSWMSLIDLANSMELHPSISKDY